MRVAIHQPQYLPWLGLIDRIAQCDTFVLLDNVPYSKNYFHNRNRIKMQNGWIWLTVPVLTKGRFGQLIKDVEINNQTRWREKHWLSISHAYKNAPYFDLYKEFFAELYAREWHLLVDLNETIMMYLMTQLGLAAKVTRASQLKASGAKSQLILRICQEVGADVYISGIDGAKYLDEAAFAREGIKVIYQDFHHPVYPQQFGEFLPQMAAIDMLFNCGPETLRILQDRNTKRIECCLP
jgi:hypothetical protein